MKKVEFTHDNYGLMSTTVENWIEYNIFDATIENIDEDNVIGDVFPVYKEDCSNPKVIEY